MPAPVNVALPTGTAPPPQNQFEPLMLPLTLGGFADEGIRMRSGGTAAVTGADPNGRQSAAGAATQMATTSSRIIGGDSLQPGDDLRRDRLRRRQLVCALSGRHRHGDLVLVLQNLERRQP
jgi:hypothetical protein